jgi:hypothetical protein
MTQTTFRRQRLSKPVALFFDDSNPCNAVLQYEPSTARISIFPQLSPDGFPDVEDVPLEITKKAPAQLFSNGHAAWFEIDGRKRCFFTIHANGETLKTDSTDEKTGSQVVTIQTDATGKLEAVKVFPGMSNEPMEYVRKAAHLYRFESAAKAIESADTKILPIDQKSMRHEYVATLTAPGIKFSITGNVSELRDAGLNPDGYKHWRKAYLWSSGNSTAVVGLSTLGFWHVGSYDSTGALTDTQKVKLFTTALSIAASNLDKAW